MKTRKHLDIRLPHLRIPLWWPDLPEDWRTWLPSRGNVLFTLLVVVGLLWVSNAGALPLRTPAAGTSTGTIAYQGRLADADGNPLTGTYNMIFRLYDVASGGVPLWEEQWTGSNGAQVSDGLFNIMLGSLTQIPMDMVTGHDTLWLGITVGTDDEMTPRVQLGSVPFAVQALTVPDRSITTDKIADGAVTQAKAPFALGGPGDNSRVEVGRANTHGNGEVTVTFSQPFSSPPKVLISAYSTGSSSVGTYLKSVSTSGFEARCWYWNGDIIWPAEMSIYWIAIGN